MCRSLCAMLLPSPDHVMHVLLTSPDHVHTHVLPRRGWCSWCSGKGLVPGAPVLQGN